MNEKRRAMLKATALALSSRADRAAKYQAVRCMLLAGQIRYRPLNGRTVVLQKDQRFVTSEEKSILKSKGNAAIRMKELMRVTREEWHWLATNHPTYIKWVRAIDYPEDMWWSDPDRMIDARPASVKESWNAARSLALMGEQAADTSEFDAPTIEEAREMEPEASDEELRAAYGIDDEIVDEIKPREASERESLAEAVDSDRPGIVRGEDYYGNDHPIPDEDPLRAFVSRHIGYPVLESQASFIARGSNDDLDDLFGEEPRDDRGQVAARILKQRQWRASRTEESFQEASCFPFKKTSHCLPSGVEQVNELFGEETPAPKFDDMNKLVKGFFLTRGEYYAQKEINMSGFDKEYELTNASLADLKLPEIKALGYERDYRGWKRSESPHEIKRSLIGERPLAHVNPAAPARPALKKGQKWVKLSCAH